MSFVIVTSEPFPNGYAGTSRIRCHCWGLSRCGVAVHVLVVRPTEDRADVRNHAVEGSAAGARFLYTAGTTVRSNRFRTRRFQDAAGRMAAAREIRRIHRSDPVEALLLYSNYPADICGFFAVARTLGILFLGEKSEYPLPRFQGTPRGQAVARLYSHAVYRLFDGMLVMTPALMEYLGPALRKGAGMLHAPMTAETQRFNSSFPRPMEGRYVAYAGAPGGTKDGVPTLLEAFALLSKQHTDLKLCIVGDGPGPGVLDALSSLAARLGIADRLVLAGRLDPDQVPPYLCNAEALCLARPDNRQAAGGFPTKLGEYLATGVPVVVTRVGSVPDYLEHGTSAFLSPPDDPAAFAAALDMALSDPASRARVGAAGRRLALEHFSPDALARRTLDFVRRLAAGHGGRT
jgi:glycosyltransferase involved in cell wall biosynthesis